MHVTGCTLLTEHISFKMVCHMGAKLFKSKLAYSVAVIIPYLHFSVERFNANNILKCKAALNLN